MFPLIRIIWQNPPILFSESGLWAYEHRIGIYLFLNKLFTILRLTSMRFPIGFCPSKLIQNVKRSWKMVRAYLPDNRRLYWFLYCARIPFTLTRIVIVKWLLSCDWYALGSSIWLAQLQKVKWVQKKKNTWNWVMSVLLHDSNIDITFNHFDMGIYWNLRRKKRK